MLDSSGLEALRTVCRRFEVLGKKVVVRNLPKDIAESFKAMDKAASGGRAPPGRIVETSEATNPKYTAAVDRSRPLS